MKKSKKGGSLQKADKIEKNCRSIKIITLGFLFLFLQLFETTTIEDNKEGLGPV